MADISKCATGDLCDLRDNCYRYLAVENRHQSYIAPPEPGLDCEYYIPDKQDYMKPIKSSYCKSANPDE